MFAALILVVLSASPERCVRFTDVCAPEGATLEGEVQNGYGGTVTISSPRPFSALGVRFAAHQRVTVAVNPWSSSTGERGAHVSVAGVLDAPQTVSGVVVMGRVAVMQEQSGRPRIAPLLAQGTTADAGRFETAAFQVQVPAGTVVSGSVELSGTRTTLNVPADVSVKGLDLKAGEVRLDTTDAIDKLAGVLAKPQSVGGVELTGAIEARFNREDGGVALVRGTVTAATPIETIMTITGTMPAGTSFSVSSLHSTLTTDLPVLVAGVPLLPIPNPNGRSQISINLNDAWVVLGVAVPGGSRVDGLLLGGQLGLGQVRGSRVGNVQGALLEPATRLGLRFAAGKPFFTTIADEPPTVRGTLVAPQELGPYSVKGELSLTMADGGIESIEATLAKPSPFEQWTLPAGTTFSRYAAGWSFKTPPRTPARALRSFPETIDFVVEARSDPSGLNVTVARSWRPKGSPFSFAGSFGVDARGCVSGSASGATVGAFVFAKNDAASVTWCEGAIAEASGSYAVPDLKVGRWYATAAFAGSPDDQAPDPEARSSPQGHPSRGKGFWIQVNRLCSAASGIPTPQPPARWVFVDQQGAPLTPADRAVLELRASRRGVPCPEVKCCVP